MDSCRDDPEEHHHANQRVCDSVPRRNQRAKVEPRVHSTAGDARLHFNLTVSEILLGIKAIRFDLLLK